MARSKASRASIAERALRQAIEEETASLREELRVAKVHILKLQNVLANIAGIARNAMGEIDEEPVVVPGPHVQPQVVPIPTGPEAELAEGDNMGDGRWV